MSVHIRVPLDYKSNVFDSLLECYFYHSLTPDLHWCAWVGYVELLMVTGKKVLPLFPPYECGLLAGGNIFHMPPDTFHHTEFVGHLFLRIARPGVQPESGFPHSFPLIPKGLCALLSPGLGG